jgi:hypothetical protein
MALQTNKNQFEFLRLMSIFQAYLVQYCLEHGYMATYGDTYRDPRCPYGSEVSSHHMRLAMDINLIKNRKLIRNSQGHRDLGKFWKSLSHKCTWGGDWGDYNHYSFLEGDQQ